jgi:hypothetical protein
MPHLASYLQNSVEDVLIANKISFRLSIAHTNPMLAVKLGARQWSHVRMYPKHFCSSSQASL